MGLQSAPTLSSAVSATQDKYEKLVLDFVYIMLIFKPYIVVSLSVKNVKLTEQQLMFLSVRSGTSNFCL